MDFVERSLIDRIELLDAHTVARPFVTFAENVRSLQLAMCILRDSRLFLYCIVLYYILLYFKKSCDKRTWYSKKASYNKKY